MTSPRRFASRLFAVLAVAALWLAGGAAADRPEAELAVATVQGNGDVDYTGTAALFQSWGSAATSSVAGVALSVDAPRVRVEVYNETSLIVTNPVGEDVAVLGEPSGPFRSTYEGLQVWSTRVQGSHGLQVLRPDGSLGLTGRSEGGSYSNAAGVFMDQDAVRPQTAADAGDQGSQGGSGFSSVRIDAPHVVGEAPSAAERNFTLRGSMELEVFGFVLQGTSAAGPVEIRTGVHEWQGAGGSRWLSRTFARLHVEDGEVGYSAMGGSDRTTWASPILDLAVGSGTLVLQDATGLLGDRRLSHERAVVQAPYHVRMVPAAEAMDVRLMPEAPAPEDGGLFYVPRSWRDAMGLVAAGLAAVGVPGVIGWWGVHRMRFPSLTRVEAALEAGDYAKAARLAGRILQHDPEAEAARISRAIALAKDGRANVVVDELEPYLASHAPEDGVMHYVLGLALLDLGREAAARDAFQAAVQRTPDLVHDVEARFLTPFASTRPVEGQAYA